MSRDGFRTARLDRLARTLVGDSERWATTIVKRMGSRDAALLGRLTAEAAAFATCLLQTRIDPDHRDLGLEQKVVRAMRSAWNAVSTRQGSSRSDPLVPNSVVAPPSGGESRVALDCALELHRQPSAGAQQAAREFQKATGLGAQALVGAGANLAALVFYHRVFLAARQSADFDATHRAEIVRAAQQVRERFEKTLSREWGSSPKPGGGQAALTEPRRASLTPVPAEPPPKG